MPADVRPYFVPAPDVVSWEPWRLLEGQDWSLMPESVDGWDPGTDLHVARRVKVNLDMFRRQTGLDLSDVAVAVSWTSSTTGMTSFVAPVGFGVDGSAVVDAVLIGDQLAGTLTLRTTISLIRRPASVTAGVASIVGSVLAEHAQALVLESRSSMFPVHKIDFANTRLSPAASWHLETATDLTAPFYGTFRILINKRDRELGAAVVRGAKDKRQQALVDELEAGLTALLLEMAIGLRDELGERDDWPADTVGDVLIRLLDASGLTTGTASSPQELAELRTRVTGAVRDMGRGRIFQ